MCTNDGRVITTCRPEPMAIPPEIALVTVYRPNSFPIPIELK
jgi:hypothetical protein